MKRTRKNIKYQLISLIDKYGFITLIGIIYILLIVIGGLMTR